MKKNNKGFSLVELIIVIAIMVALIAVLAPSYVKYVQKSRVSAYENACEDFVASVKEAYADPEDGLTGDCIITIKAPASNKTFVECCTADSDANKTAMNALLSRANAGGKALQKITGTASQYVITCSGGEVSVVVTPNVAAA